MNSQPDLDLRFSDSQALPSEIISLWDEGNFSGILPSITLPTLYARAAVWKLKVVNKN